MLKRGIFLAPLLLIAFSAMAQPPRLVRYHKYYPDSSRIVDRNMCYFIRGARVNRNDGIPIRVVDLVPAETDVVFFETTYDERLLFAFEIKKGATKVQLNSASPGPAVWLTNYYEMSTRKQETRDFLTGQLTLRPVGNSEILINGKLNVDSEYPATHQEIVFDQSKLKISTLPEIISMKTDQQAQARRQDEIVMGWASILVKEKKHFWDSVFSTEKYPGNIIEATIHGNQIPGVELHQSAILLDSELTGQPSPRFIMLDNFNGSFVEDALEVANGNRKVLVLSFIHDGTNYCVAVEIDSANSAGKTILLYRDNELIISPAKASSIKIIKDGVKSIFGTIEVEFQPTDAKTITLSGTFELPKLQRADIRKLEEGIKRKQQEYLSSKH